MKKIIILATSEVLTTSTILTTTAEDFTIKNVDKMVCENGRTLLPIKDWKADPAKTTGTSSPYNREIKRTKLSNEIITGGQYDTYYFTTAPKEIGYTEIQGSVMGYLAIPLYSEFWIGHLEIKAGEKSSEVIAFGYYRNDNYDLLESSKLFLNLDYTDKNKIVYELVSENIAEVYRIGGWQSTGATFNFDLDVSW